MLTDDLLALQRIDTTADQLTHRRSQLPERVAARDAELRLRANRARRVASVARIEELELSIGTLERDGEALTAQRARLQGQLRTIVAPREAEALMHELDALARHRDELDDQELAHLEEQSDLADEITRLDDAVGDLESMVATAGGALGAVEGSIADELATLAADRSELMARIDADVLDRYERLRARHGGVAIARLDGKRCGGCHLDLSAGELDAVKAVGAGELADCPQCGRLLVP